MEMDDGASDNVMMVQPCNFPYIDAAISALESPTNYPPAVKKAVIKRKGKCLQ